MPLEKRTALPLMTFMATVGLSGCVSDPGFEQPMGDSVRKMISVQTYEPERPADEPSPMIYDGSQSQRSLETYRARNAVRPETQTIRVGR